MLLAFVSDEVRQFVALRAGIAAAQFDAVTCRGGPVALRQFAARVRCDAPPTPRFSYCMGLRARAAAEGAGFSVMASLKLEF